ncbi:uncharacterized protein LOC132755069 isoform X2 [Ruditapes philippinarum]|uniref:uncharacterized protein LOC132755069 isoform X2 n=1 Tax=Ruditapes philippinarum TaxID=129788 RepID=UPI00295A81EE|nr:uncharacterized protein LOC132755069 isoform X2 [Ruditapes philippinarum]
MISVYTILLLCVCSSGAAKSGGGILLKIGQHGLNEAISYVMDNVLIPYLENDLNIQTFNIPLGAATILIEKLGLHTLEGQHGMVNILDDNKISIKVGFSKIGLKANLTRVAPDDNIYAPDTVVFFTDCNLKVIFSLGLGEKKDGVTLDSCKTAIGSFSAKGTLGAALEGLFLIGGSASIASLVEQICPSLENITNENLDDILSVQDTVKISTRKHGDISVNMKLLSASTQANDIEMKAEVTTGADSFVGNVSFPGHSRRKTSRAANLLINDILLGEVFKYAIQVDVFKGFELQTTIGKNNYTIQVNETSIQSRLTSSSEGVSVILNVTFNVYTEYQCLGYRLTMDTVTPLVLGLNNTLIQVETDKYRLQKHFTVSYWNKTCLQNIEKLGESKNVQWEILSQTNSEYEKRLIEYRPA